MKEYEERIKQIEEMTNSKVDEIRKKVADKLNNWSSNFYPNNLIDFC